MVLIVTGASVQVFRFADTHKNLTITTDEFIGNLRVVQGRALSFYRSNKNNERHTCGFGIKILNNKKYIVYSTWAHHEQYLKNPNVCHEGLGANEKDVFYSYDDANELDDSKQGGIKKEEEFTLRKGVVFDGDSLNKDIFFLAPYSEVKTNSSDGFIFKSESDSNNFSKTIKVNGLGMIEEE